MHAHLSFALPALLLGCGLRAQADFVPVRGSELREHIEAWVADRGSVSRRHSAPLSKLRRERLFRLHEDWLGRVRRLDFAKLSRDGQVDWLLFDNHLRRQLADLGLEHARDREVLALVPWATTVVELVEARQAVEPLDPAAAAKTLDALVATIDASTSAMKTQKPNASVALRAANRLGAVRRALGEWFRFRDGYDPLFSWWLRKPHEAADAAIARSERFLREECVGKAADGGEPLVGDPLGRDALLSELRFELIPYSPEELVQLAEREFAWCDAEFEKAATELGFAGDWHKAQEHVKGLHVGPGEQTRLIQELAREAVAFLDERDLLTIPDLARETWRMEMMSPARQLVNPFFLGGESIIVSFPTDTMAHADKMQSMRGNNVHFSRATVQHELIPGHHLQQFTQARCRPYREVFDTPFWVEGWALYWEMRLYDMGFAKIAADRVGMLFWRKHRCARIVFSLRYHLGEWNPQQCIDYLVERVGHERANATAEVRRSIVGNYGPLYQAGYMLGGLQLRALQRELVGGGKLSERAFHDRVLQQNSIPIELVRAALTDAPLSPTFQSSWRFYEVK